MKSGCGLEGGRGFGGRDDEDVRVLKLEYGVSSSGTKAPYR